MNKKRIWEIVKQSMKENKKLLDQLAKED